MIFQLITEKKYAIESKVRIKFIGVLDTVGALGIPFRMFGFLNEKHLFHDNKIGPNIDVARHAMAIDELRDDFKTYNLEEKKRDGSTAGLVFRCALRCGRWL